MGDFKGHFGPGTFFLLGALFIFFRGLPLRFTKCLKTDRRFIILPPLVALVGSSVMGIGEVIAAESKFGDSHVAHYRLNFAVFALGAVTLLHMFQLLPGSFWGLVPGLSWITMGLLMGAHHQHSLALTIAHVISANLFILWGLSAMAEYLSGVYASQSDLSAHDQTFSSSFTKSTGMFFSYGNLGMYRTPFPLLHSFIAMMNGVWWYIMAFEFYLEAPDGKAWSQDLLNDHMSGTMLIYGMLYNLILGTVSLSVVLALGAHYYDLKVHAGARVAES